MHLELYNAIYKWLKSGTHSNVLFGAALLKLKTLEFAKKLSFKNFYASDGWLDWQEKNYSMPVLKLHQIISSL